MTLKLRLRTSTSYYCFGTIQSNMTLKPGKLDANEIDSFGTIQSNMTLKRYVR